MEKFFPILKQCPLFAHIAESDLSAMLHCLQVTVQHYDKGQIVIHEGEKAERFGIVLTGAVQLWRIDYSGNRSIMANVEPAQIFGESFVCAEVESIPIQAVASASCDVMLIDGSRILHACGNGCEFHQQVIFHLLQIIARKNLVFHQKLEITSKRTTREKLLTYLNQQAQRNEKACDIVGEAELGRPHHRLKRPDGAGPGRRRTGVAVQPRHADGLPRPLIQSALEKVRQMQVGQQRRPRLNPAPEAGHGL
mgnify:CR=1 FL=1